jgi:hypothetical protein
MNSDAATPAASRIRWWILLMLFLAMTINSNVSYHSGSREVFAAKRTAKRSRVLLHRQ